MGKRRLVVLLAAMGMAFAACDDDAGTTNTDTALGDSAEGDAPVDGTEADTDEGDATGSDGTSETDTDEGDATEDATAEDATDGDATQTTDATGDDTTTTTDATDDGDAEENCTGGTLCGRPATCCPAGNECVNDVCLEFCESGVRCGGDGTACCDTGQLCIADACVSPEGSCLDSYDCAEGYFCEPTLGQCLTQPETVSCTVVPSFEQLDAAVEWSWTAEEVISSPMVADLNGDGFPEVVVNATQVGRSDWVSGRIVILDGRDGTEIRRIAHDPPNSYGSHGRSTVGLGDVNGDALPDIVYATHGDCVDGGNCSSTGYIVAVDGTNGDLLWVAKDPTGAEVSVRVENGAPTLANFDADPEAEIVFGAMLIDNDGRVVWNQGGDGPNFGTNNGYRGGISAVADIDGDGRPDIVSGRHAWTVEWVGGTPPTVNVTEKWTATIADDGYPAIADLDADGKPEVILVARGRVAVLEGTTGKYWCGIDPTGTACDANDALRTQPIAIPGGGRGGPPTVSDFDDDGRPEVGVAGGSSYSVYDFYRSNEDVVQPSGATPAQEGEIFVRWSRTTKDQSSNATGSSVFDFQGDGSAEVVYGDECYMRVYSGFDGQTILEIPSTSSTIHEYPIVVDVDADGNSEILIVANTNSGNPTSCPTTAGRRDGLFVYGDANDEWVPTRRVWTQHAYHVTNANSRGNVPLFEQNSWAVDGLNNYRQNVQGEGVFNAPDLAVSVSVALNKCGQGLLVVQARVTNVGALGVPAGVPVSFYAGTDASGTLLGTVNTTEDLLPGASTVVTYDASVGAGGGLDFYVVVDDDGSSSSAVVECDESNNSGSTTNVFCLSN